MEVMFAAALAAQEPEKTFDVVVPIQGDVISLDDAKSQQAQHQQHGDCSRLHVDSGIDSLRLQYVWQSEAPQQQLYLSSSSSQPPRRHYETHCKTIEWVNAPSAFTNIDVL